MAEFAKIVGQRRQSPAGSPPPPASRSAMREMARYRTRVPKGVFFYRDHEAANRDWERWQLDSVKARQQELQQNRE